MKNIFLSIIILVSAFFIQTECIAQTRIVNGMVTTFDSIPLVDASIKVKSTKQEVKTDTNGRYKVECTSDDILKVSANGFYSKKVKLDKELENVNVDLKLKSGDKNLNAAISNGHISDQESFRVIADLNDNTEDFSRFANVYEIIENKFPGVQISQGYLIIRGANRLNVGAAENAALIVVDGAINDNSILSTLPTSLVKSIKIMKEGSNAIYGSRGANGVVVIKTKTAGDV